MYAEADHVVWFNTLIFFHFIQSFFLQTNTYNKNRPFGNSIITDLIRSHWFSRGKIDQAALKEMIETKKIPHPIIILVVTAVSF